VNRGSCANCDELNGDYVFDFTGAYCTGGDQGSGVRYYTTMVLDSVPNGCYGYHNPCLTLYRMDNGTRRIVFYLGNYAGGHAWQLDEQTGDPFECTSLNVNLSPVAPAFNCDHLNSTATVTGAVT
jgi:hypothetical protein